MQPNYNEDNIITATLPLRTITSRTKHKKGIVPTYLFKKRLNTAVKHYEPSYTKETLEINI